MQSAAGDTMLNAKTARTLMFRIDNSSSWQTSITTAQTQWNDLNKDHDFRIDGTSDNVFFLDGGLNRVGVGTALPSGILHVSNAGTGIIVANEHITGNAFEVHGAQGNLLTITDDLSDSLMSVNDAAGMPVFEVFADDTIKSYRNNESKFEVDPDNNRIRLRDNLDVSGMAVISGAVGIGTASMARPDGSLASSLKLYKDGAAGGERFLDIATDNGLIFSVVNYHQHKSSCYLRTEGSMYIGTSGEVDALLIADTSITCKQPFMADIAAVGGSAIGGGTTAGSMLSVNGDVGITGDLKVACGHGADNGALISDGTYGANYAAFSHAQCNSAAQYALLQSNDGNTYLNAVAAKHIRFALGGTTKFELDNDGNFNITGLCKVSSNGIKFSDGTTQTTAGGGGGGISFNGSTTNGVVTYGNSSTADVESKLTFDGTTLDVDGNIKATFPARGGTIDASTRILVGSANTPTTTIDYITATALIYQCDMTVSATSIGHGGTITWGVEVNGVGPDQVSVTWPSAS
jgi:hypothetical protein